MGSRQSTKNAPVKAVLRWEFDNIIEMNPLTIDIQNSAESVSAGLSWKIFTTAEQSARTGNVPHLGIFIDCRNPGSSKFWSCEVRSILKLIHRNDEAKTITGQHDLTFYPDSSQYGTGLFKLVHWNKVIDPTEGFLLGNKIILEADITIVKTYGVGVIRKVNKFCEPDETCDVCLIVEGKKVHVSKAILAAHSPVFKAMFYGKFQEREKTEIPIEDVKHKDFIELLNVAYTSLHEICDDSVERIIVLADRFQVNIVLEACEVFLLLNSRMSMAKKLLLTDAYKLNDSQAQLIYSMKDADELTALKKEVSYDKYSNALKGKILDRTCELA